MAPSIEQLAAQYARTKAEKVVAERAEKEAAKNLMDALNAAGRDGLEVPDAYGGALRVTMVKGTKIVTDYDALEKKIGPRLFKTILSTKTYVDDEKVKAQVALGKITVEQLADVSEEKPIAPYLKPSGDYDLDTLGGGTAKKRGRVR